MLHRDVVLPTAGSFPDPYDGTPASGTIMTGSAADRFRTGTYREETIASGCDDATTRYRPGNEPVRSLSAKTWRTTRSC